MNTKNQPCHSKYFPCYNYKENVNQCLRNISYRNKNNMNVLKLRYKTFKIKTEEEIIYLGT